MKTGSDLAQWARARLLPVGDPLDAIAEVVARLHSVSAPQIRSSVPDHRRAGAGRIIIELHSQIHPTWLALHRLTKASAFVAAGRTADIFSAGDVAVRVSRWRRVLNAALATENLPAEHNKLGRAVHEVD